MPADKRYDDEIIGAGAGGGALGHRIATNGANVLRLERGPFLLREHGNWSPEAVFVGGNHLAPVVWYCRHGKHFQPEVDSYVGESTKSMLIGARAHQSGTAHLGIDSAASALDVNCEAHEVGELSEGGTSFVPSIGAVNTSLSAIANALRVGDHPAERLPRDEAVIP